MLDVDLDMLPGLFDETTAGRRAILYARMFWPQFVEKRGIVLLESTVEDEADERRLREAIENYKGDRATVERDFNFHELDALFGTLSELSGAEEKWLLETVADMWRARLREQFPSRDFRVETVWPGRSDGHEPGVVFYQVQPV